MTKLVNDVSHKGEAVNDENALLHTALPAGFEVEEINNTHTEKRNCCSGKICENLMWAI